MATQFGKIPGKYDVIKRKKGQELTAPVFTSGQTVDPMAAPAASTTNPPTDELVAKVPSYKISKLPGSNLMSQLQANTSKMQSDLSEVDKNSTVQKQFSLLQQLERTIVDPVDREKFEQDKANIEAQYQNAKGAKEGARTFTLIAEGLANIAGGLIAGNKGIGYSPVKFEGIDWDKQITRLGDEATQQKGDVDKSLASAMTQQTQAQDLADKDYAAKAGIMGTGIQLSQQEDASKRNLITQLGGQTAQGITAASGDERARQEFGAQDTQKKNEYDYRAYNDAENRKLEAAKIEAARQAALLKGKGNKEFQKQQAQLPAIQTTMDEIDKGIDAAIKYSKGNIGGTGPIASVGGLRAVNNKELENLKAQYNTLNVKNMAQTFQGMSKAIDSDAERRAWNATQPSINKDDTTNIQIMLGMKSLLLKQKAEIEAQRDYAAENEGKMDGYISPVLGKMSTVVNNKGDLILVDNSAVGDYPSLDEYAENAISRGSRQIGEPGIRMRAPNGQETTVPKEKVQYFLDKGAEVIK